MMDETSSIDEKAGTLLRLLYRTSLVLLLVMVGLWICALFFPTTRIVYDQLGMTEPGLFDRIKWHFVAVAGAAMVLTPFVALVLSIIGAIVLRSGRRQTMKRWAVINWSFLAAVFLLWYLLVAAGSRQWVAGS